MDDWEFGEHPDEAQLNLFGFCENNPVTLLDPLGLDTYTQDRQLLVPALLLGGAPLEKSNTVTHRFVFTTNRDGTISHTYSWGNAANTRGWNKDQPEDLLAAQEGLEQRTAVKEGNADLDPFVEKAYHRNVKASKQHDNGGTHDNCKTEAKRLLDKAREIQKKAADSEADKKSEKKEIPVNPKIDREQR